MKSRTFTLFSILVSGALGVTAAAFAHVTLSRSCHHSKVLYDRTWSLEEFMGLPTTLGFPQLTSKDMMAKPDLAIFCHKVRMRILPYLKSDREFDIRLDYDHTPRLEFGWPLVTGPSSHRVVMLQGRGRFVNAVIFELDATGEPVRLDYFNYAVNATIFGLFAWLIIAAGITLIGKLRHWVQRCQRDKPRHVSAFPVIALDKAAESSMSEVCCKPPSDRLGL